MQIRAKLYIATVLTGGALSLAYAMAGWSCADPLHYLCQLAIALVASGLKVKLPGILSTMSVSYVFVVLSMMEFSYPETVALACMATAVQCLWRPKYPPKLLQLAFNVASMAIAVSAGYGIYHIFPGGNRALPLRVGLAAIGYFLTNTLSVAGVVAADRRQEPAPHLEGVLLLVLPLLPGGRWHRRPDQHLQPLGWAGRPPSSACPWSTLFSARTGSIWAGWSRRRSTPRKSRPCTCAPSRRWRWPSKPRTRTPTSICSGCRSTRWSWASGRGSRKATCRRCARPPSCTTSASWRCRSTSSRNRAS